MRGLECARAGKGSIEHASSCPPASLVVAEAPFVQIPGPGTVLSPGEATAALGASSQRGEVCGPHADDLGGPEPLSPQLLLMETQDC